MGKVIDQKTLDEAKRRYKLAAELADEITRIFQGHHMLECLLAISILQDIAKTNHPEVYADWEHAIKVGDKFFVKYQDSSHVH